MKVWALQQDDPRKKTQGLIDVVVIEMEDYEADTTNDTKRSALVEK